MGENKSGGAATLTDGRRLDIDRVVLTAATPEWQLASDKSRATAPQLLSAAAASCLLHLAAVTRAPVQFGQI